MLARWLDAHLVEHALGEPRDLPGHHLDDRQQGLVIYGRLAYPGCEVFAARVPIFRPALRSSARTPFSSFRACSERPALPSAVPAKAAGRASNMRRAIPAAGAHNLRALRIIAVNVVLRERGPSGSPATDNRC